MRRSKPLALLVGASMLTLAACGGGDGGDNNGGAAQDDREYAAADEVVKNPDRAEGPAYEIKDATEGGDITVYLPGDPGPSTLEPAEGWSVTGNSIQQALTNRSLTQYARNPETGGMELIPDLATDLGRPNEDFTEWTFTLRDGVKWENGKDITPEELAFGISRTLDAEAFPSGPGTEYSRHYFLDGETYKGPYTSGQEYKGVEVNGRDVTIKMSEPFPDMDWWGAFMAIGPAPLGDAAAPPKYGRDPLATGPYKIESFTPTDELVLVKNEQWDPATDPGRHQYPDSYTFKFNADPAQTDQILLSGNAASETVISTDLDSVNYRKATEELGDRMVQQSSQCTSFQYPVYDKTTKGVRQAMALAIDYEATWLAGGQVPGVTRVPANSIMPPGMAGKPDYNALGEPTTFNPEKAKELLAEEGYDESNPFKIVMIYYEPDPLAVKTNDQLVRGFEEAGFEVQAIPVQVDPYDIWLDPDNATNKKLTLRGVNWCSDWPSGLTMIPSLLRTGAAYNTGGYSNPEMDKEMDKISLLPAEEQAEAWGALDELIQTTDFPIIPTAYRNDLFTHGSRIGNFYGDGSIGAPNYKDLYVISE